MRPCTCGSHDGGTHGGAGRGFVPYRGRWSRPGRSLRHGSPGRGAGPRRALRQSQLGEAGGGSGEGRLPRPGHRFSRAMGSRAAEINRRPAAERSTRYSGGGPVLAGKRRQDRQCDWRQHGRRGGGYSGDPRAPRRNSTASFCWLPCRWRKPERLNGPKLSVVSRGDRARRQGPGSNSKRRPSPKSLMMLEGSAHAQFLFQTDQGERLMKKILGVFVGEQNRGGKK